MNIKNCKYVGHDHKQVDLFALKKHANYQDLSVLFRDDIHRHEKQQNRHIVNQEQFNKISLEKINKLKQEQKQQYIQYSEFLKSVKANLHQISERIKFIIVQIEKQQKSYISQEDELTLECFVKVSNYNDFSSLDEDLLQQLFKIENYQFNKNFKKQMKDELDSISLINSQIINQLEKQVIKGLKYELQDIFQTQESQIFSSTISDNIKYLVCGGTESLLRIWNIQEEYQEYFKIQLDSWIYISKFTKDSSFLYVGTQKGFLYQLDGLHNFDQIKKLQVHSDYIFNIQLVTNNIILSVSKDNHLIKTDFNSNCQIFRILAHQDRIDGIEFDFDNQLIVTSFDDTSIKLWDSHNGDLVFCVPDAHNNKKQIKQVVLQQHKSKLFSLDNQKNIRVWYIDLNNKSLQLQNSISDENLIFNLSLIFDQKYILIICRDYIKILDISGQCIQQINHNISKFYMYKTIQLDSINKIIIKGIQQLTLCQVFLD